MENCQEDMFPKNLILALMTALDTHDAHHEKVSVYRAADAASHAMMAKPTEELKTALNAKADIANETRLDKICYYSSFQPGDTVNLQWTGSCAQRRALDLGGVETTFGTYMLLVRICSYLGNIAIS